MSVRVINRIFCTLLVGAVAQTASAQLDLSWYTIDGGGVTFSSGGGLDLAATAGQPDAGIMTGGTLTLIGGFWSLPVLCAGDVNGDNKVDLQDLATLLSNFGTPSGATLQDGDLDGDGDVDLQDLANLLSAFGTNCL